MNNESIKILKKIINFTYDDYIILLKYLKDYYNIIPFEEYKRTSPPKLILRHDIDVSLIPALRMAEIENRFGIHSTYFVIFSERFYNPLEKSNLQKLRKISEMGHEIGLHYDSLQYEDYDQPFNDVLNREITLLERLIKKPVTAIARHNLFLGGGDPFKGSRKPLNAYNDEFFKNALYVSDSCRAWYLEDIYKLLTRTSPIVQLVIHPMLWSNVACTRSELLDSFFQELEKDNMEYKEYWKSIWMEAKQVQTFDKEIDQFLKLKDRKKY